jgi:succinyl-CoA synthetase alpha subunit
MWCSAAALCCVRAQIKMIVVLGELGGTDEYSLVSALKEGECTSPPCL